MAKNSRGTTEEEISALREEVERLKEEIENCKEVISYGTELFHKCQKAFKGGVFRVDSDGDIHVGKYLLPKRFYGYDELKEFYDMFYESYDSKQK